jgi:hypothetical protein
MTLSDQYTRYRYGSQSYNVDCTSLISKGGDGLYALTICHSTQATARYRLQFNGCGSGTGKTIYIQYVQQHHLQICAHVHNNHSKVFRFRCHGYFIGFGNLLYNVYQTGGYSSAFQRIYCLWTSPYFWIH